MLSKGVLSDVVSRQRRAEVSQPRNTNRTQIASQVKAGGSSITYQDPSTIASGAALVGWTTLSLTIPSGAKGVILECEIRDAPGADHTIKLNVRRDSNGQAYQACVLRTGNGENHDAVNQGFYPISTQRKIDYQVTSTDANPPTSWQIRLVAYHT